jgi:hypothetical protein
MYHIQHCFICRPLDSTVSEDAGIEPRTVATTALAVRHSNHSARSLPSHPVDEISKLDKLHVPLAFIKLLVYFWKDFLYFENSKEQSTISWGRPYRCSQR